MGGREGRKKAVHVSTLETAEEDHKEGATEFLTTAAADEDWQQFFLNRIPALLHVENNIGPQQRL